MPSPSPRIWATVRCCRRRICRQGAGTAAAQRAAPGQPAEGLPEFELQGLEGGLRSIRSWPDRALVINFWATWCAPCLREIPLLKAFQAAHAEAPVQVVGIAIDQLEPVQNFAEEIAFNYPILVGEADAINAAAAFGVDFFARCRSPCSPTPRAGCSACTPARYTPRISIT